jgi:hypothetical protein
MRTRAHHQSQHFLRRARLGLAISAAVLLFLFVPSFCARADGGRMVGLSYWTGHTVSSWQHVWGKPELGEYDSKNPIIIAKHAKWLSDAGVDFIFVDWSNDLPYSPGCGCRPDMQPIEDATYAVFDTFGKLQQHPKIAVMIGFPGQPTAPLDGRLQRKADQVYNDFIANEKRRAVYEFYEGKPLLIVYAGTPTPYQRGLPPWNDPRFTVRFMTGFITQQKNLLGFGRVSKYGYWSWEDRGPQTYTIENGYPEAMTVTASWRPDINAHVAGRSRMDGTTFTDEWARARAIGVKLALVVSWNEWEISEQINAESSKDLEPSAEFGEFYLDLLKQQIWQFKADY